MKQLLCYAALVIAIWVGPEVHAIPVPNSNAETDLLTVEFSGDEVVSVSSLEFLSVAVDASQIVDADQFNHTFSRMNWSRPLLISLAKNLAPAVLRIGGTNADKIYYNLSSATLPPGQGLPEGYTLAMQPSQVDALFQFGAETGLGIVFGLNGGPGPRGGDMGPWDPTNAKAFLAYIAESGFELAGVQLSNEPNLFLANFGKYLQADTLGADFKTLKELMRSVNMTNVQIYGPDVAMQIPVLGQVFPDYLGKVVKHSEHTIDSVTFHWYPLESDHCPAKSIDPWIATTRKSIEYSTASSIDSAVHKSMESVKKYDTQAKLWLGEGALACCGGQENVTNAFASTIWYVDLLGRMAAKGVNGVVRQVLSGGRYGIIDDANLYPNPDFWAAVLWKNIVGKTALHTSTGLFEKSISAYTHCSAQTAGDIVIAAVNRGHDPYDISIKGAPEHSRALLWELTAPEGDLSSRQVLLNGKLLSVSPGGALPHFSPSVVNLPFTMSPHSIAFLSVSVNATACYGSNI